MKKGLITIIAIIVVVIVLYGWIKSAQNDFVKGEEAVESAWAQVENVYQRRADLIPNLVATVKGYAEHESSTLEAVVNARANATSMKIDAQDLSEEALARYNKAQGELSSALGRLLMIQENYPDLKANENFRDLQVQLEGTENRITVERQKFNDTAKEYNTMIRKFPRNILASMFGFEKKPYFAAAEGAQNAPVVQF